MKKTAYFFPAAFGGGDLTRGARAVALALPVAGARTSSCFLFLVFTCRAGAAMMRLMEAHMQQYRDPASLPQCGHTLAFAAGRAFNDLQTFVARVFFALLSNRSMLASLAATLDPSASYPRPCKSCTILAGRTSSDPACKMFFPRT